MKKLLTVNEYRRRVFNNTLSECFSILYEQVLGETIADEKTLKKISFLSNEAKRVFSETLNLENATMNETRTALAKTPTFISSLVLDISEAVAKDKAEDYADNKDKIDTITTDLSDTDKELIEKIFSERIEDGELNEIRDAVVRATLAEKRKTEEIQALADLDKKTSPDATLSESTMTILNRSPGTILEAIYKSQMLEVTNEAIEKGLNLNTIINDNREAIKENGNRYYTIFECINKAGFKAYSAEDVKVIIKGIMS